MKQPEFLLSLMPAMRAGFSGGWVVLLLALALLNSSVAQAEPPPQATPDPVPDSGQNVSLEQPTPAEASTPEGKANGDTDVEDGKNNVKTEDEAEKNDAPYPRFYPKARLQTGLERREVFSGTSGDEDSRQPFFLDSARIGFDMEINSSLDATFEAELTDSPVVRDAYVNLKVKRWVQLRAGHFKRPISRTELQGIGSLPFRDRGISSEFLRDAGWAGRTLGVMAWGKVRKPKLRWSLAAMNAGRSVDVSDTERLRGVQVLGRVQLEPVPWLEVAVDGGHMVSEPYPDGPNQQLSAIGADVALELGGLRVVLEARLAQNPDPPAPPSPTGRTPFALELLGYATYDLPVAKTFALQPIVALERLDTDRDLSGDETLRAVGGLNLVFWEGTFRLLPQVEIIRPIGDEGPRSATKQTTYYLLLSFQL